MEKVVDLEKEFKPSLLNSAIYLLQLIQQISTFAINYQGRPFRESIRENRAMYWGLLITGGIAFAGAMETFPSINEQLKLVPFTEEFKFILTTTMVIDYAGCWICETGFKHFFSDYKPKPIAERRPDQLEREILRQEAAAEAAAEALVVKAEEAAGRRR
jgi:cation-transporting ATPase 13A1